MAIPITMWVRVSETLFFRNIIIAIKTFTHAYVLMIASCHIMAYHVHHHITNNDDTDKFCSTNYYICPLS